MKKGRIKHATQGGQILLHELHMMAQVVYKLMLWLLPIGLLVTAISFVCITEPYHRYIGWQWLNSQWYVLVDSHHQQTLRLSSGQIITVHSSQFISTPFVIQII